jgi:Fe-S oxidoreductase
MLDLAKRQLRQILDHLRPAIRAGVPVVGLEPSCISVFRDELPNLMGQDTDAFRLSRQAFTLDEFLMRDGSGYQPPRLAAKALVHGHCHQKAVLDMEPHGRILAAMGVESGIPESGCCGLAGSFGFEKGKYELSRAIGERHLLPAIRSAPEDTLLIANGFSCREQMRLVPGANPLHLSQVIHRALKGEKESEALRGRFWRRNSRSADWKTGLAILLAVLAGMACWIEGINGKRKSRRR